MPLGLPRLTLTALRKRFGPVVAVDGLSLEVGRGEVFGLLGPNGAGKSTTVHLAVGLLTPDEGHVDVAGRGSPLDPEARRAIGIAPQTLSLYEDLTAEENLAFFGRIYRIEGARARARAAWGLEFAGLTDRRHDRVATFSGGMKRRLNLAAALIHEPAIVLLDEPTAGVDPQSRHAIFDRIEALRADGLSVVYTTHYMEEAARLCDRVGIVDHGRLLALDTVDGLLRAHGGDPTLVVRSGQETLRVPTRDPLAELTRVAASRRVDDFHVERTTLEHVFLNLTGRSLRD
jgi:ABC-2 type transport system ATP-binding protein